MPYFLNPRFLRAAPQLRMGLQPGLLPIESLQQSSKSMQSLPARRLLVRTYPRFNRHVQQPFIPITKIGTSLFRKLVTESTVFVDKTEFIKEFLNSNADSLLFTYPRRWGKSMNLDMIKTFVEIEVDKDGKEIADKDKINPRLFSHGKVKQDGTKGPLAIFSEKKLIAEHMGKYPVISLSFKDIHGGDYNALEKAMNIKIQNLYKSHKYLLYSKSLSDVDKESFEKTLKGCVDTEELKVSLKKLGEFLYQHFDRNLVVLIDEYDAPINHAHSSFDQSDINSAIELIRDLLGNILKGEGESYTYRGLVTGILRVAKANIFSGLNNLVEFNILNEKYSTYYGFTEKEVNELLDSYNVPIEIRETIKAWYNGYNIDGLQIYNPWSIVNCLSNWHDSKRKNTHALQKEILRSYWEESGSIGYLNNVFKMPLITEKIKQLIDGRILSFNLYKYLSTNEFATIRELANASSNFELNQNSVDIFFSYLFTAGYLTSGDQPDEFKIPNHEIKLEFERKILVFYRELYNIDNAFFKAVTNTIQAYLDAPTFDYLLACEKFEQDFTTSFQALLYQFPRFKKLSVSGINDQSDSQQVIHANEDVIHSIINYIALQVKTMSKFATELPVHGKRADVVLIDAQNKKAIIIELKYNNSANDALEQIKERQYAQDINRHLDTTMVGLNVDRDKKVDIAVEYLPRTCPYSTHTFVRSALKSR